MRNSPSRHNDAERIDRLWDALIDDPSDIDGSYGEDRDLETAKFIAHLSQSLVVDADASRRLQSLFESMTQEETNVNPTLARNPRTEISDIPLPRFWTAPGRFSQLANRIAAALLIVALILSSFVIGPGRSLLPNAVEHQLAAIPGFSRNEDSSSSIDNNLFGIVLEPGASSTGEIPVGLWRITLAPGEVARIDTDISALGPYPFVEYVESGELTLEYEHEVWTVDETNHLPSHAGLPRGLRNETTEPVTLLFLAPADSSNNIPVTFDSGIGSQANLLGMNTVSQDDGPYAQVVVSRFSSVGLFATTDDASYGSLDYLYVDTGELLESVSNGTPAIVYPAGTAIDFKTNHVDRSRLSENPNVPFTGLAVFSGSQTGAVPVEQLATQQAPYWLDWIVPESGRISLMIQKLTLAPGTSYSYASDGVVMYSVISGSPTISFDLDTINVRVLTSGEVVGQGTNATITLKSPSDAPVVLIQAVVAEGGSEATTPGQPAPGVSMDSLTTASGTLPSGPVTIALRQEGIPADGGGTSATGVPALTMLTTFDGPINVARLGGEAEVIHQDGLRMTDLPLGDQNPIGPGDTFVAASGSGWQITGGDSPTTAIELQVAINAPLGATPETIDATPVSGNRTIEIRGNADDCAAIPLTRDDLDRLVATPSAETVPLTRSLRNAPDGTSADDETSSEVTSMLTSFVNCASTGWYALQYPFFSDQALRENNTAREMIELKPEENGSPAPAAASFEDIQVFPDGRVGVRFVLNTEIAYLTLVQQDGEWKIDVWDDTWEPYPNDATPTS